MRERLSVTVITKNEEKRIAKCLESVAFADEILVVDSGSTDRTAEIARQYGARVIQQAWLGYGRQKQFAVDQAKNDWVLSLDADEVVSEVLSKSIISELNLLRFSAYSIMRINVFAGRPLRYGDAGTDWVVRMFDRRRARWSDDTVHEKVEVINPVGTLGGELTHYTDLGISHYFRKQKKYAEIYECREREFKLITVFKVVISPIWRFLRSYIIRFGFLDSYQGFLHAIIASYGVFLKYSKCLKN